MEKCGICFKEVQQLFETEKNGIYACFKCQPLVPEITMNDHPNEDIETNLYSNDDSDGPFICLICSKSYPKSVQLKTHMKVHQADRRFICTYCNKAFSQSNNLRAHLRIHTNERPYKCSECGKAFTQITNLNNHVRLHTGERPYACSEPGCDKAFAQVTNLNQHRKRHLSGRPIDTEYHHNCADCGAKFVHKNHFNIHRRQIHGYSAERPTGSKMVSETTAEEPHACGACPGTFPSAQQLRRHISSNHADNHAANADGMISCVFSSCSATFLSAGEHTEHLLTAHQLKLMSSKPLEYCLKRGRPPKKASNVTVSVDTLDPKENFHEVFIRGEPLPKLKVQSLFQ